MAEKTADDSTNEEGDTPKKKGGLKKLLIWIVVAVIGIGAGFATPIMLMSGPTEIDEPQENTLPENQLPVPDPGEEVDFLPFNEVVVNFNDPRASRYLKLKFSLQVAKSQADDITKLLEEKHDILINWLIGHIADKRVEDIRGTQGTNRLRREIHDSFNGLLFSDGIERIQDVLFQELNIQ